MLPDRLEAVRVLYLKAEAATATENDFAASFEGWVKKQVKKHCVFLGKNTHYGMLLTFRFGLVTDRQCWVDWKRALSVRYEDQFLYLRSLEIFVLK